MNIGGLTIYALDEAKNATCAREMWLDKEYIVPTFNAEMRGDKPPLHYYFMMAGYTTWGPNAFGARFFSSVMGALTILIAFIFANRHLNNPTAWMTAAILWASLHFSLQFHMAVPDPYLVFFLTLTLFSFFDYIYHPRWLSLLLMYTAIACGVLTKGPVAIAVPGLIMLLFLLFTRRLNFKVITSFRPLMGILWVLLLTLPWYVAVHLLTDGAWTEEFFLKHNVGRFTNTMEGHGGLFLLTPLYILLGMLPFSVFILQAFFAGWKNRLEHPLLLLCIIQILCFTGFFAISSTKLPNYTVPVYPFLAILLAHYIVRIERIDKTLYISLGIYLLITLLIPVGGFIAMGKDELLQPFRYYAGLWLVLPIAATAALYFTKRGAFLTKAMPVIVLSWLIAAGAFYYIIFPKIDQQNPIVQHMDILNDRSHIAQYQIINRAFNFYIPYPIPRLETPEAVEKYWKAHPDAYIISRERYLDDLSDISGIETLVSQKDLFENHTTVILRLDKSTNLR